MWLGVAAALLGSTSAASQPFGPGDLVVSEAMVHPTGNEAVREWIELHNPAATPVDIRGLTVSDGAGQMFTMTSTLPLIVSAGRFFVLGRSAVEALNGGVIVDYVYSGLRLANDRGAIVVAERGTLIDRVDYDGAFPLQEGAALMLDPRWLDAEENDDAQRWCVPSAAMPGGDFGTPGVVNQACPNAPDETPPEITHTPVADGQSLQLAVVLTAVVTDASALPVVELHYRTVGGVAFQTDDMVALGNDLYQGIVLAQFVTLAGVEYYLRAVDDEGNEALEPADGASAPFSFTVRDSDIVGPSMQHAPSNVPLVAGEPYAVVASISDPAGVSEATLFFRLDGALWQSVAFTPLPAVVDGYSAAIPGAMTVPPGVEYYLSANDTLGNQAFLPPNAPVGTFGLTVVPSDDSGPMIVHPEIQSGQPARTPVEIAAEVTDATGVAAVQAYFRKRGTRSFFRTTLARDTGAIYRGTIPGEIVVGDAIEYYLEALDMSPNANRSTSPNGAPQQFYVFTIADHDVTGPEIEHTPPPDGQAAGQTVGVEAAVTDGSGIRTVSLFFRHAESTTFRKTPMTTSAAGLVFRAHIPGQLVAPGAFEYFIEAEDRAMPANVARSPAEAPTTVYGFTVVEAESLDPDPRGCSCRSENGTRSSSTSAYLLAFGAICAGFRRRSFAV